MGQINLSLYWFTRLLSLPMKWGGFALIASPFGKLISGRESSHWLLQIAREAAEPMAGLSVMERQLPPPPPLSLKEKPKETTGNIVRERRSQGVFLNPLF